MDGLPFVVGVLLCVLTIQLGLWQTRRAEEKIALGERLEAAQAEPAIAPANVDQVDEWTRVELTGRWLADKTILVDNRVYQGQPGFHVLTPLATRSGAVVLVRRGWIATGRDRSVLPEIRTPADEVTLIGQVRVPEAKPYSLAEQAGQGRLWQYLDMAAYGKAFALDVSERIVEQTSDADDALVRDWPRPDLGIDRHRGYAAQWFGLAALSAALVIWFGWRRWQQHGNG